MNISIYNGEFVNPRTWMRRISEVLLLFGNEEFDVGFLQLR